MSVVLAGNGETWRRRGHVFMVADGMGAHAAGELASKIAADTVPHTYLKHPLELPHDALKAAVEDANQKIHERGQANADFRGMGTTASVLSLSPAGALVAHVGDSRVYRLRGDRYEQLSFDHSLVWEMMLSGNMKENEVPGYIPKNIITRSLGPSETVQVDLEGMFPIERGDVYLLCSDGLSGQVTDEEMGVVLGALPVQEAARGLVDLANLRGGPDNITVIVARVKAAPSAARAWSGASSSGKSNLDVGSMLGWMATGVLALAAGMLALLGDFTLAAVLGVLSIGAAVAVFMRQSRSSGVAPQAAPTNMPLGKGPYRSRACANKDEFVGRLATIASQLREAATEQNWTLDWAKFNDFSERGLKAAEKGDFVEAVRQYIHAISFMMDELREQRRRNGDESANEGNGR